MKKYILLSLCIVAATHLFAGLNIYPSALSSKAITADRKLPITYCLNASATKLEFLLLNEAKEVVQTIDITSYAPLTMGTHKDVNIDLYSVPQGDYTWALKATAAANAKLSLQNDPAQTRFNFYSPQGIVVDNSMTSPYFGRIYVSESRAKNTTNGRAVKQGIYIFDAALTDVTSQGNTAYGGGVSWNETGKEQEDMIFSPGRLGIDEDGYVYVCDNYASQSNVYRLDPANPSNNFVSMLDAAKRGTIFNRANSVAFTGNGANRVMYVMDVSKGILKVEIGNNTSLSTANLLINTTTYGTNIANNFNTLVHGVKNDFWVFQNRGSLDTYPVLTHYNSKGIRDFYISNTSNSSLTTTGNMRGNGAVSPDGKYLAFCGGLKLWIYEVAYDANGKPTLTKISETTSHGKNVEGIAFDVANNLYFASATAEHFYAYALPKADNSFTTIARAQYNISLTTDNAKPHIMAYNLNSQLEDDDYKFSFYANMDAMSAKVIFYLSDGTKAGEYPIAQTIKKGNNLITIPASQLPSTEECTWAIQLTGEDNNVFGPIHKETTILIRLHAVIDNSPESDYFGRIYAENRVKGGEGYVYIYDYDYSPIVTKGLCGMTHLQSAGRPAVDAEGYVYWADYGDNHGGIWVMNPKTLQTSAFFVGSQASSGVWTNGSGVEMGSSTPGAHIYGTGKNTKLFMVNEDAGSSLPKNGYLVYNIGQADGTIKRTWNQAPSKKVALSDKDGGDFSIVGTSHGAWVCQHRGKGANIAGARSLMFYDNNGTRQYNSTNTTHINGSLGGGMAVSADESMLAMVNGDGNILIFDIAWNGDVPTLTYKTTYTTAFGGIGTIHFDYAGNLVTTIGTYKTTMQLIVYSTPTDNNVTTIPAKSSLKVKKIDNFVEVTAVTLNHTAATIDMGQTLQLQATVTPNDATDPDLTWTSGDETIATVNADGLVTSKAPGNVTITVQAGEKTATCQLTINKIDFAVQWHTNGGYLSSPATNEDLWTLFMPDYNAYYKLNRATQPITAVTTFAYEKMIKFVTDPASAWAWLGAYVQTVCTAQGAALTTEEEGPWRFNVGAFFNCSPQKNDFPQNYDFTQAGLPKNWRPYYAEAKLPKTLRATDALPTTIIRQGYEFLGWYDNPSLTGAPISSVTNDMQLYAKWNKLPLTLADNVDNTEILADNLSQSVDVVLHRSLVSGMYNTICLPFSLPSLLGTDLAGSTLVRFLNATITGEGMSRELTLYFTPAQSIEAGVPYLIIPANDITTPMSFSNVTIACTEGTTSGSGDVIYQGVLRPTELTEGDLNSLFLISNNQLAWPEVTESMKGMRGYFKVSPSTAEMLRSVNARARIQLQENQTTSLPSLEEGSDMVKFIRDGQLYIQRGAKLYNAQGQVVE